MRWDEEERLIFAGCEQSDEYFCFGPSRFTEAVGGKRKTPQSEVTETAPH